VVPWGPLPRDPDELTQSQVTFGRDALPGPVEARDVLVQLRHREARVPPPEALVVRHRRHPHGGCPSPRHAEAREIPSPPRHETVALLRSGAAARECGTPELGDLAGPARRWARRAARPSSRSARPERRAGRRGPGRGSASEETAGSGCRPPAQRGEDGPRRSRRSRRDVVSRAAPQRPSLRCGHEWPGVASPGPQPEQSRPDRGRDARPAVVLGAVAALASQLGLRALSRSGPPVRCGPVGPAPPTRPTASTPPSGGLPAAHSRVTAQVQAPAGPTAFAARAWSGTARSGDLQ
jgi:hypothetical protein